jgi:hypothetical protein
MLALRLRVDPLILGEKSQVGPTIRVLYDTLCRAWTVAIVNYFGASFCVMLTHSAHTVWNSLYWWGHVACIAILIMFKLFSPLKKAAHEKAN